MISSKPKLRNKITVWSWAVVVDTRQRYIRIFVSKLFIVSGLGINYLLKMKYETLKAIQLNLEDVFCISHQFISKILYSCFMRPF